MPSIVRRDFKRAGASHILALSGLHVSIIMGALMLFLKRLRIDIKKIAILLSICSVIYLFITGMSLSATRAVIMILFVYAGILFEGRHDSLTSLSFAGMLILLITPGAVLDGGFWMSFSATLGLLVYMPAFVDFMNKIFEKFKGHKFIVKSVKFILNLVATSFCALIPLITVMCIFSGEISYFSVISSVALSIPTTVMLVLSIFYLIFSEVPFISVILSFAINSVADFMIKFCAEISNTEHVVASLKYPFIIIAAIIIGAAIVYSCVFRLRNVFIALTPYVITVLLLISSIATFNYINKDIVKTTYVNASTKADMLVISNDREAIIIDIGSGSNNSYRLALNQITDHRATEIQALVLTKCTNSHPSTLINLFSNSMIREIWIPYPTTEDDYYRTVPILDIAERSGVKAVVYKDGEYLKAFDSVNIEIYRDSIERSAVPVFAVSVNSKGERLLYISPAYNESERIDEFNLLLKKSEYVVFGNRGPVTKTSYGLPEGRDTELVIFADKTRAAYFESAEEQDLTLISANEPINIYIKK